MVKQSQGLVQTGSRKNGAEKKSHCQSKSQRIPEKVSVGDATFTKVRIELELVGKGQRSLINLCSPPFTENGVCFCFRIIQIWTHVCEFGQREQSENSDVLKVKAMEQIQIRNYNWALNHEFTEERCGERHNVILQMRKAKIIGHQMV